MKTKLITFIVIALFWGTTAFLPSCGKKDDATTLTQDTSKTQQNTQQQTQQQITEKKDSAKVDDKKKEEEKKKEEDKKKEEEKKKEDEKKKKEEEKKKEEVDPKISDDINFAAIWPKKCAKCHGKDGTGKVEGVPNLTLGETKGKSLNQLINTITNGKKGKTDDDEDMPSFKGKLSEDEIKAAAKYVKGL